MTGSIFDKQDEDRKNVSGDTDEDIDDNNVSYFDRLVQDSPHLKDKEQNELLEELAKARHFGNSHIAKIERENAELRKELDKRLTLEEFIDKMNNRTQDNPDSHDDREHNSDSRMFDGSDDDRHEVGNRNAVDVNDVYSKVKQLFEQETQQSKRAQNLETVSETLREAWGGAWKQDLRTRARELGLGEDFLNNLAQESPKAFLDLVGVKKVDTRINPPQSRAAPEASRFGNQGRNLGSHKTYKDYSKMRKENPKAYYSVDVQRQMEKDLKALGESVFYS